MPGDWPEARVLHGGSPITYRGGRHCMTRMGASRGWMSRYHRHLVADPSDNLLGSCGTRPKQANSKFGAGKHSSYSRRWTAQSAHGRRAWLNSILKSQLIIQAE